MANWIFSLRVEAFTMVLVAVHVTGRVAGIVKR